MALQSEKDFRTCTPKLFLDQVNQNHFPHKCIT